MGKIIIVSFRPSRLPPRLLKDGWWLETPPARRAVIAFPKHLAAKSESKPRVRHLIPVTSGK